MNTHQSIAEESTCRLKLAGPMTFECRQELEEVIIGAMRRYKNLEADLSDVSAIDLYGVHLLGLLQSVGAVVAIAPNIEESAMRLLISNRGVVGMSRSAQKAQALAF